MALATTIHNWPGPYTNAEFLPFSSNIGKPEYNLGSLPISPSQQILPKRIQVPNRYENKYKRDKGYRRTTRHSKNYVFTRAPEVKSREQFQWNTNSNPFARRAYQTNDDGVVLLVGLFNLLAVVVYAGQQILSGLSEQTDNRAIYWQVQKALDELVLRVHSSDTAANLISRALEGSVSLETGRKLTDNNLSHNIVDILSNKNVTKTKITLNKVITKLKDDITSVPTTFLGPKIDPRIYLPIRELYERFNKGRNFSLNILRKVNLIIQTLRKMNVLEIRNALKALVRLHHSRNRRNILNQFQNEHLKTKSAIWNEGKTIKSKLIQKRNRRSPTGISQGRFSKYHPKYSKAAMRYKARKIKELFYIKNKTSNEDDTPDISTTPQTENQFMKRQGLWDVKESGNQVATSSRPDGWFLLLTEASPIALDLLTLYSRAKSSPICLRTLLCKSNGFWKKKGPFHAALSPFLSVIASWGMEKESPHSLGDSIIAIRAGWMGKYCEDLYPECVIQAEVHPLTKHTLNFFSESNEELPSDTQSLFSSKTGEIKTDNAVEESQQFSFEISVSSTTTTEQPTTIFTTFSTPPPITTTDKTTTKSIITTKVMTTEQPTLNIIFPNKKLFNISEDKIQHPYDRYDSPYYIPSNKEELHSGSVTGMALQDRPLKQMSAEESSIFINNLEIKQPQHSYQYQHHHHEAKPQHDQQPLQYPQEQQLENTLQHLHHLQEQLENAHQHDLQEQQQQLENTHQHRYDHHHRRHQQQQHQLHHHHHHHHHLQHQQQRQKQQPKPEQVNDIPQLLHLKQPNSYQRESQHEVPPQYASLIRKQPNKFYLKNHASNDHLSKRISSTKREPAMLSVPPFLSEKNYSSYMASQRPTIIKHDRGVPYVTSTQESVEKSYAKILLPKKRVKYKYALRRGLPARNVDGHGPLIETEQFENPKYRNNYQNYEEKPDDIQKNIHEDFTSSHLKSHQNFPSTTQASFLQRHHSFPRTTRSPFLQGHHNFPSTTQVPLPTTYNPKLFTKEEKDKYVSQFSLKDAITDRFKNELLYQYIRDRTLDK